MRERPYTPTILRRLWEIHSALDGAELEHCVGGAIALANYTQDPRPTDDIDLNVMVDPEAVEVLLRTLPDSIDIPDGAAESLRRDGQIRVWWRDPPTALDLFIPQHPTYHRLVQDRSVLVDFDGVPIRVLTATDLMVFKMLFDRRKDWADIEALLDVGAGDPDEAAGIIADLLGEDDYRINKLYEMQPRRDWQPIQGPKLIVALQASLARASVLCRVIRHDLTPCPNHRPCGIHPYGASKR